MEGVVYADSIGKIRRRQIQLRAASNDDQFRHSLISQIRKEVALVKQFLEESHVSEIESELSTIEKSLAPKLEPVKSKADNQYYA